MEATGLTFMASLTGEIILAVFQLFVIAALFFMKKQPGAPEALRPLTFGFIFMLVAKGFYFARMFNNDPSLAIFEVTSFSLVMGMFITAACLLKGVKANMLFTLFISLILFVFMSYAIFVSAAAYLKYVVHYMSICIGFTALSIGFMPKRENKADYGFFLTSLTFFALAVSSLLMISGWFRYYFGTDISIVLYFLLAISILLAGANVLENKVASLSEEVTAERKKLWLLVKASPFPIVIFRLRDEKILMINSKTEELLGIRMENLPSCKVSAFFDCPNFKEKMIARLERSKDFDNFDIRLSPGKVPPLYAGTWFSLSSHIIDFEYEIAVYSVLQDITKRKQKEQELINEASKDPLTSCYTRRFFEDLTRKEIARSIHNHTDFCFMMIDADHFKNVNDTYGHDVGDKVLKALADTCHRVLRGSDIIGRFGGEEFLIMLTEITPQNAEMIANRLREAIGRLVIAGNNGESISFTVSMGLATSLYTTDYHTLVKAADTALYQAKEAGKSAIVVF